MAEIKSVNELLNMKLDIPNYQRPYKWDIQNIDDLLSDITNAISDADRYRTDFKYRIGTIILHKTKDGIYDVVDGQQRIISLVLLKQCVEPEFTCSILEKDFTNKVTQYNIHRNYGFIREWFSLKSDEAKKEFITAFDKILEVVVICVDKISEAFQLFDSQNTRGKALDPHDLLKAYHLREMKKYPYEMEHAVTKWEAKDTDQIGELFDLYLFPIWNWSRGIKSRPFTAKEIDTYKGIAEGSTYSYARRVSRAMPYFQITEPFIAGNDFFEMVEHYMYLLRDSKIDLYMLREADKGFLYIGKRISRSLKNESLSGLVLIYDHSLVILADEDEEVQADIAICKSNSGISGGRLAAAHVRLGEKIGRHIATVFPEKNTSILVLERGGRFFGDGVYMGAGGIFYSMNPKQDDTPVINTERVVIVDSVINTGKSIMRIIDELKNHNPSIDVIIAANVIQNEAVELFKDYLVFATRLSKNSFVGVNQSKQTGKTGPDTADRLFNLIKKRY